MVVVYTDGACVRNGYQGAQAGWGVYFPDLNGYDALGPLPGIRQTNSRAELWAILRALQIMYHKFDRDYDHTIYTDSRYCVDIFDDWIRKWRQTDYTKRNGDPVQNVDIIKSIEKLLRKIGPVEFEWVRGHSSCHENEMADNYARRGAQDEWMKNG
ncbi:unnamed protein product [Sympodiomycopsis kandeliae]